MERMSPVCSNIQSKQSDAGTVRSSLGRYLPLPQLSIVPLPGDSVYYSNYYVHYLITVFWQNSLSASFIYCSDLAQ